MAGYRLPWTAGAANVFPVTAKLLTVPSIVEIVKSWLLPRVACPGRIRVPLVWPH